MIMIAKAKRKFRKFSMYRTCQLQIVYKKLHQDTICILTHSIHSQLTHPTLSLQLCSLKTHSHRVRVCSQSDTGIHFVLITFTVSRFWSNHLFTRNSPSSSTRPNAFLFFTGFTLLTSFFSQIKHLQLVKKS